MAPKITTIQEDRTGDVYTGKEESRSSGIADLAIGIICPPFLAGALSSSGQTTVVVNGERHTGRKVK